jgi:2-dehydropantoate 2-reductase
MRIANMGADSLGTIIGALLTRAGYDITLIDANAAHVKALNLEGARVKGNLDFVVPMKAVTPDKIDGLFELVIYLVKTTCDHLDLPQIKPHLAENGMLITL